MVSLNLLEETRFEKVPVRVYEHDDIAAVDVAFRRLCEVSTELCSRSKFCKTA